MVSLAKRSAGLTTPAAPLRWLCGIFLMAQPSPLRGGECIPLRQRLEDGALHHVLSDIDLVGVHTHGTGYSSDSGRGLFDGILNVLALELVFYACGPIGNRCDTAQHDAAVFPVVVLGRECCGNADQSEIRSEE